MFLRKMQFEAKYQFHLYLIKIDPVKEFPGNNRPLYFYLFNILVF